jgi:hypothetical protein
MGADGRTCDAGVERDGADNLFAPSALTDAVRDVRLIGP